MVVEFSEDQATPLKKGPWTAEEDALLLAYVSRHGDGNWNTVQKYSGVFRNGKSCRLRWTNHLRPNLKKGAFSPEEERIIIEQHAAIGNRWSRIAAMLPGRTDNEIKNFWNTRKKRRSRAGLPLYPASILLRPVAATGNATSTVASPPESIITSLQSQQQPQKENIASVNDHLQSVVDRTTNFLLNSSTDLFNAALCAAEAQGNAGKTLINAKRARDADDRTHCQRYSAYQTTPPIHEQAGQQSPIPVDSRSLHHQVVLPAPPDIMTTQNGYGDSLSFSNGGNESYRNEVNSCLPVSRELPSVQSTESADSSSGLSTSFTVTYQMLSLSEVDSFNRSAKCETLGSNDGNLLDVVLQQRDPEFHHLRLKTDGITEQQQQQEAQTLKTYCNCPSPRSLSQFDSDPLSFLGGRSLTLLSDDLNVAMESEGVSSDGLLAAGEEVHGEHKQKEVTSSSLCIEQEEDELLTLLAFGRLDSMSFAGLYEEQGGSSSDAASMDPDEEFMNSGGGLEAMFANVHNDTATLDSSNTSWEQQQQLDSCLLWNNMPGAVEGRVLLMKHSLRT